MNGGAGYLSMEKKFNNATALRKRVEWSPKGSADFIGTEPTEHATRIRHEYEMRDTPKLKKYLGK